jgi:hypothetical protein
LEETEESIEPLRLLILDDSTDPPRDAVPFEEVELDLEGSPRARPDVLRDDLRIIFLLDVEKLFIMIAGIL